MCLDDFLKYTFSGSAGVVLAIYQTQTNSAISLFPVQKEKALQGCFTLLSAKS
jgi:hypothetical protein